MAKGRKKGDKKPPGSGRKVGSVNKKTIQWKTFSEYCMNGGLDRFKRELDKLRGEQYVRHFLNLMEFHQPKLTRTTHVDNDGNALPIVQFMMPVNGRDNNQPLALPENPPENPQT